MRKKTIFGKFYSLTILLTLLVLIIYGCSGPSSSPPPAAAREDGVKAIPVKIASARTTAVQRTVDFVATLLPDEEVKISSEVQGIVKEVTVDFGDPIKRGQVLVRLDRKEYELMLNQTSAAVQFSQENIAKARKAVEASTANVDKARASARAGKANLEKAKAMLEDAKLQLSRMTQLASEGLVPDSQKDGAKTQYDIASAQVNWAIADLDAQEAALRAADSNFALDQAAVKVAEASLKQSAASMALIQNKLDNTVIHSPINGLVKKKVVSVGEMVKENVPLLELISADPLRLRGDIPERYASEIKSGQTVIASVDAFPNKAFEGKVSRIGPAANVENRSFTLEALLSNPELLLKPGFFARSSVVTRTDSKAVMVPDISVITFAGLTKLFVIEGGRAQERIVELGTKSGKDVEVLKGIKEGELVAISALNRLENGTPIKVEQ